jgi:hypothetical protein
MTRYDAREDEHMTLLRRFLTAKSLLSMYGLLTDRERTAIEKRISQWVKKR